jgi:hypothetical protein
MSLVKLIAGMLRPFFRFLYSDEELRKFRKTSNSELKTRPVKSKKTSPKTRKHPKGRPSSDTKIYNHPRSNHAD